MSKFVKDTKYVYGWSKVDSKGKITIPIEARKKYNLGDAKKVFLIPSVRRSGGFGVATEESLKNSPLAKRVLNKNQQLADYKLNEGEYIEIKGRPYCWVKLHSDGSFNVPEETLKRFKINPGEDLLLMKRSNLALGFLAQGPIIKEAKKHSELKKFD